MRVFPFVRSNPRVLASDRSATASAFCGSPENTAGQDAETCGERKAGDCGGVAAAAAKKSGLRCGREFLNPYDQKAPSPAVLGCRALGVPPHPLGGVEVHARALAFSRVNASEISTE